MPTVKYYTTKYYKGNDLELKRPGDAGFDLCYSGDVAIAIQRDIIYKIPTGIKFAIPQGYFGLVLERSGLAVKHGFEILGRVIDSGYRGEVFIICSTTSSIQVDIDSHGENCHKNIDDLIIKPGDRIAQIVFTKFLEETERVSDLEDLGRSERGENGFGSTGI
jgi:dUTP pyrophosphatase